MIILFENGRLGNQLFQYAGLRYYFPFERIVFVGCEELNHALRQIDAIFIKKSDLPRILRFGLLFKVVRIFIFLRFFGSVKENISECHFELVRRRGLLFNVFMAQDCFFQHFLFFKQIMSEAISLEPSLLCEAKAWLEKRVTKGCYDKLVFLHVRRGDYLAWPDPLLPAVLEKDWYHRAMEQMRDSVPDPIFLILTDDSSYAREVFGSQTDVVISDNKQGVDLALMSLCSHGILSASTFAWWGAWLARQNNSFREFHIFIAPRYWAGHRRKEWFPVGFKTEWITYID